MSRPNRTGEFIMKDRLGAHLEHAMPDHRAAVLAIVNARFRS
jgi:hypothetical protein